jgi:hypothetical protein
MNLTGRYFKNEILENKYFILFNHRVALSLAQSFAEFNLDTPCNSVPNSVQLLCLQSNENRGIKVLWNKIIVLMNKGEKGLRVHRVRNSF